MSRLEGLSDRLHRYPVWARAAMLGTLGALLALALRQGPLGGSFDRFESMTYDWLVRTYVLHHPTPHDLPVIIVGIDHQSEQTRLPDMPFIPTPYGAYGGQRWPWPHRQVAALIWDLKRAGFKVIGADVIFGRAPNPVDDQALAEAASRAGNVVWQLKYPDLRGEAVERPIPPLRAARGSSVGIANVREDDDRSVRGLPPYYRDGSATIPSFALTLAQRYRGLSTDVRRAGSTLRVKGGAIPLNARGDIPIRYWGPAYTIHEISAVNVNGVPDGTYRGKIAIIGRFDRTDDEPGVKPIQDDLHDTPYTSVADLTDPLHSDRSDPLGGKMYGVEIQAQAAAALARHEFVRPVSPLISALLLLAAALLAAAGCSWIRPIFGIIPTVVIIALIIELVTLAFARWLIYADMHQLWLGVGLTYGLVVLERYSHESRERARTFGFLSRYVAPQVARRLTADPSAGEYGVGRVVDVTVLFCDIRSFTARSEHMQPNQVLQWLNHHLDAMVDAIHAEEGTVDKYVGDAVMAVFGSPEAQPDHAARAVRAAVAMSTALDRVNRERAASGDFTYEIGIGLHTGQAFAGNVGHRHRAEYAVMGDTVNTASRVESLTKEYGARILLSEETYNASDAAVPCQRVGECSVRGRLKPIVLYEVADGRTPSDARLVGSLAAAVPE